MNLHIVAVIIIKLLRIKRLFHLVRTPRLWRQNDRPLFCEHCVRACAIAFVDHLKRFLIKKSCNDAFCVKHQNIIEAEIQDDDQDWKKKSSSFLVHVKNEIA